MSDSDSPPLLFSNAAREYAALHSGAAIIDRSERSRIYVGGKDPTTALNGLLTNDVASLAPNAGHRSAALTSKGKIVADLRLFALDRGFLVDVPAAPAPHLLALLRKYMNPRQATFEDVSSRTGMLGVYGPRASPLLATHLEMERTALESLQAHGVIALGDDSLVVRSIDFGVSGFDVMLPVERIADLRTRLLHADAFECGEQVAEIVRIESGRPVWGVDMDDSTLVQEAGLDRLEAVSFTKGCYTGQETVARVHFRGQVNRHLRAVRGTGELHVGSTLMTADEKVVGEIRSVATSPRLGHIGLAMVRREVALPSQLVAVDGERRSLVFVDDLPFTD